MTELEFLKLLCEKRYLEDQDIVRDAKIMAGFTHEKGGKIIVHICARKARAIMHAKKFIKKYKRFCFVFDFIDYPDKVKWTKLDTKITDLSGLDVSINNIPPQSFN
jgi:hypothetical protein